MHKPKPLSKVCHLKPPSELKEKLLSFNNFENLRNNYYGLEESKSILIKYNPQYSDGMIPKMVRENSEFWKLVQPTINEVQKQYSESFCTRALISWLPPGKEVKPHIDPGWAFSIQRRFAWAIYTNPGALFQVEETTVQIPEGDVWEFDNKQMHSAINNGNTDRIHLIFDLAIIEEVIAETPTPFSRDSFDDKLFRIVLNKKKRTGQFII